VNFENKELGGPKWKNEPFFMKMFVILVAEHVYEPFYMVYVMGIVAKGTSEAF